MGVKFFYFFLQLSRGPEGPSRWPKATSSPQELEVGARRAPYLLVCYIILAGTTVLSGGPNREKYLCE